VITRHAPQVHSDDLVGRFRLSIQLWVKCRGQVELDTRQHEQLLLAMVGEHQIVIANDRAWYAMQADNVVEERSRDVDGSV
jgi:hypothetical protein